jgi:hypothetical protein
LKENEHYKSKSSAKSSDTSSDDESEVPMTCKYCIKYAKKQHPKHITPDTTAPKAHHTGYLHV